MPPVAKRKRRSVEEETINAHLWLLHCGELLPPRSMDGISRWQFEYEPDVERIEQLWHEHRDDILEADPLFQQGD